MSKKNLYAFIISFVLLIAVIAVNRLSFNKMKDYSERVDHTRQVITAFESISNHFKSAQIYTKTYSDIPEKNFYILYKKDVDNINGELTQLRQLVNDNPEQVHLVDSLASFIHEQMGLLMTKNIAEIIQSGESWRLNKYLVINQMINRGISTEEILLVDRKSNLNNSTRLTNRLTTAFAVIAVAIILFTFISYFFISRQRKWLEGFLESILNTSQNGIIHYKAVRQHNKIIDFKVEFVNRAIDRLLKIKPEEMIDKKLSELPVYVIETELMEKYIQVVETGKSIEFEILYKCNDIEIWLLVSMAKLDDGLIASFNDISQLKKYEEELKATISSLQRSNVELEQYAYVASHDLQEPLRKIRSFGSYLQDTQANKLDEKGQQQLTKIMSSAERMSLLIKDILTFSALKKQDAFVLTDLNKIVATVLQDLDLMITQKNAVIQIDTLPVVEAIPLQMNQLFHNLIINSLKFAKEDKQLQINVSARKIKEVEKLPAFFKNTNYFEIIVSDNGIGFNQDYADQIFGLFKRLNDRQPYPGSGIGLSLCRKVVQNHNGEIIAKGKENEGAGFYIFLPEKQM